MQELRDRAAGSLLGTPLATREDSCESLSHSYQEVSDRVADAELCIYLIMLRSQRWRDRNSHSLHIQETQFDGASKFSLRDDSFRMFPFTTQQCVLSYIGGQGTGSCRLPPLTLDQRHSHSPAVGPPVVTAVSHTRVSWPSTPLIVYKAE